MVTEKILVSIEIYFDEKIINTILVYLYNDHKVKPLNHET